MKPLAVLEANIALARGPFALDVKFRADRQIVTLLGESGSGKTSILLSLAGILKPARGAIVVEGETWFDAARSVDLRPQKRAVGYVPQHYGLFPHMTVADNITYACRHGGREERFPFDELLRVMRLRGLEARLPSQLSGGQQQRVALARALIVRPSLLLLDEPFASLDRVIRDRLLEDLSDLHARYELTTILVTHDLEDAYTVSDRIGILAEGRLLQWGTREDIFARPRTEAVARLTGVRNIFDATVVATDARGALLETKGFQVWAPPGPALRSRVRFAVRPELITLLRRDRRHVAAEAEVLVEARIVREVAHGPFHTLFFAVGDRATTSYRDYDLEARIGRHTYEVLGVAEHRAWTLALQRSAVHVLGTGESAVADGQGGKSAGGVQIDIP